MLGIFESWKKKPQPLIPEKKNPEHHFWAHLRKRVSQWKLNEGETELELLDMDIDSKSVHFKFKELLFSLSIPEHLFQEKPLKTFPFKIYSKQDLPWLDDLNHHLLANIDTSFEDVLYEIVWTISQHNEKELEKPSKTENQMKLKFELGEDDQDPSNVVDVVEEVNQRLHKINKKSKISSLRVDPILNSVVVSLLVPQLLDAETLKVLEMTTTSCVCIYLSIPDLLAKKIPRSSVTQSDGSSFLAQHHIQRTVNAYFESLWHLPPEISPTNSPRNGSPESPITPLIDSPRPIPSPLQPQPSQSPQPLPSPLPPQELSLSSPSPQPPDTDGKGCEIVTVPTLLESPLPKEDNQTEVGKESLEPSKKTTTTTTTSTTTKKTTTTPETDQGIIKKSHSKKKKNKKRSSVTEKPVAPKPLPIILQELKESISEKSELYLSELGFDKIVSIAALVDFNGDLQRTAEYLTENVDDQNFGVSPIFCNNVDYLLSAKFGLKESVIALKLTDNTLSRAHELLSNSSELTNTLLGLVTFIMDRLTNYNHYCTICNKHHICAPRTPVICSSDSCIIFYSSLLSKNKTIQYQICPFEQCSLEATASIRGFVDKLYKVEQEQKPSNDNDMVTVASAVPRSILFQLHGHKFLPKSEVEKLLSASGLFTALDVENVIRPKLLARFLKKWEEFKKKYKGHPELHTPRLGFHGTPNANVQSIIEKGLLVPGSKSLEGKKITHATDAGWYGKGVYLSPNPSTSLGYCKGGSKLFICSVLLGKSVEFGYKRASIVGQGGSLKWGYDSHTAENGNEFVIFDSAQILPCYVVSTR